MTTTTTKSAYWQGIRDGLPFPLVLGPFAALFGVVATESGLSVFQTLAFSVTVIAGAAQFAALQMMNENAPTLIVIASALAVNLRMAMYSASLASHFGGAPLWKRALAAYITVDQNYALAIPKYDANPTMTASEKIAYFAGAISPSLPAWYGCTLLGAWGGKSVPPELALDFAVPLTFLAMIGPMLRTVPHVAAALVSIAGALSLSFIPFNLGLLIAAVLAMVTGAQIELWMTRGRNHG